MAFQTSVLRGGEWVTETVNLQAALKASAAPRLTSSPVPEPPVCGILSKTIVESPIVHWVLPVRLRSNTHNDIAFIGDHFVQICELGRDGQVHEILKKNDFGPRIRNAVVLGDSLEHGLDDDAHGNTIKLEPSSSAFHQPSSWNYNGSQARSLPPQLLVLMLDSSQLIFLFVRERPDSSLEFFTSTYESPKPLLHMGYHMAVDPSSRYMAAASPDGVLAIYELEALLDLNNQYALQDSIKPVKSIRVRAIQGVIHKLEFLFPRPEDDYHIILLLIVVRKERNQGAPVSRMVTYEWELGDSLVTTFSEEKNGTRLPKEHRMPMLLIPLRFKTAFFAVSRNFIGVVKYALSGSPEFELLPTDTPMSTKLHNGVDEPLWTAWARPFRRKKYFEKTDIIYLAREDGAIIHIEIDAAELVPSVTNVGCLETNIDTAFATAYDIFSDVLIIGGDSGPGGIWKLAPREDLEQVSVLPNWSPVVDMTTTNERLHPDSSAIHVPAGQSRLRTRPINLRQQDSIFSASGRGLKGNVTHWRWGIPARIGLDIETGEPIRQAWTFTIDHHHGRRFFGLLAFPHSSAVLQFSEDLSQVDAISAENTQFDTASRTLCAIQSSEAVVQVTEVSINVVTPAQSSRCLLEDALGIAGVAAENAFCDGSVTVISTHASQQSQLHVMRADGIKFSRVSSWDAKGEVTCVSIFKVSTNNFIVAASICDGVPWISVYSLTGEPIVGQPIIIGNGDLGDPGDSYNLEPLTSICVVRQGADEVDLILGSRCGHLVTARISEKSPEHITWSVETIGVSRVDVFPASDPFSVTPTALACCDNNLIRMTNFSQQDCKFTNKHFIWPTDSNDASMPSPPIHSVYRIPHSLSGHAGHIPLMILAGSRLLLADVGLHVGHVPRSISIEGTPTRIIFSPTLNCLVVALLKGDRPTLAFIDPDTGAIISVPTDKCKNHTEFISGLGNPGDRIFGLHEWLYIKDGKMFAFILVTTKDGRLIIVSTEQTDSRKSVGSSRRLKYWTRYKKGLGKPIYSIVGDEDGLVYCVDRTLHWDVLDLAEKKLKPMREFGLDSPATSLRVVNGKILALTTMHSLEVIDHRSEDRGEMVLIHTDQVSRRTVHMIDVGDPTASHSQWPLTLMSDHMSGIAGVWIPWGQRNREFEVVFEGMLPSSVRRFAAAHSRPPWLADNLQRRYGTLPSTADGADIIGVSVDGTMQQFTLLSLELWRLLCLIQNLALKSTVVSLPGHRTSSVDSDLDESDLEPQPRPNTMHIDGDFLGKCLEPLALESIVGNGAGFALFCRYLDELENGRYTNEFRDNTGLGQREKYVRLGYEIIEFLLAPVM